MSTLGTEEGDHCREVLNKSQCMDFLSAGTKKSGCCREVAVVERWLLADFTVVFQEKKNGD